MEYGSSKDDRPVTNHCKDWLFRIDLYLDDELREEELDNFNHHLKTCPHCREELAARRQFLEQIRAARPQHVASPELRSKVAALLDPEPHAPDAGLSPLRQVADKVERFARSWLSWLGIGLVPAIAAGALIVLGVALLWRLSVREMRASAFVDMAVKAHHEELAGQLPLEITTSSPAEVSAWFTGKVPYHFRLPNYQDGPDKYSSYQLSGGRLVAFRGDNAAYIAYHMKGQLISLLIVSASSCIAAGGDRTVVRGLTFHAYQKDGLGVVTWSVHGLTYALVSNVNLSAGQSCVVCHPSAKDGDLIRALKTRNNAPISSIAHLFGGAI